MDKKSKKLNRIIYVVIFICIYVGAICISSKFLREKDTFYKYDEFHKEKKPIDVLFFGSSHTEMSISPMELWHEYGITSYNFGNPAEDLELSYWVMKNAIEVNKPKVIVFDLGMFGLYDIPKNDSIHYGLDSFPLSKTKIESVNALMEGDLNSKIEMFVPLGKFHSRWKNINENDIRNNHPYVKGSMTYGFPNNLVIYPFEQSDKQYDASDSDDEIIQSDSACLNKVIDLCEENGISLLFTVYPFYSDEERQQIINIAEEIGNERGIGCIDFIKTDFIIDYDVDFCDVTHLNLRGMHKITSLTGAYLVNNFELEDHRKDSEYIDWISSYEEYCNLKYNTILEQESLESALLVTNDDNLNVKLFYRDDSIDNSINEKLYITLDRIDNPEAMYENICKDDYDIIMLVSENDKNELKIVKAFKKNAEGYETDNIYYDFHVKY